MQPADSAQPHPVDELIMRLIRAEVDPSPEDLDRIVQRIASAPFNRDPLRVRARDRRLSISSLVEFGAEVDPLEFHLAKRVVWERQWSEGTSTHDYLGDLRSAALHARARILVYERAGDLVAATISPTADIVPAERRGVDWLPNLLVVHSARHGNVRTGYMFSMIEKLNLPESIRWLR